MRTLMSEDCAVIEFAKVINPCFNSQMTMREITEVCLDFFRQNEIEGADDSILFDWGLFMPEQFEETPDAFVDNRKTGNQMCFSEKRSLPMVAINRQILIQHGDDDSKLACQMYFERSPDFDESTYKRGEFIEFHGFGEAETAIAEFLAIPFVFQLFESQPKYLCASAELLG